MSKLEPLMSDDLLPAPRGPRGPGPIARLRARVNAAASRHWADRRSRAMLGTSAAMLLVAGAIWTYLALRPVPKPDYAQDGIDMLFSYTLLTDEFNRLPIEERIELIGQLTGRLGSMQGSDSVLLAAFAAQISGPMRDQLVENATRVVVDLTDKHASAYDPSAPLGERRRYILQSVVELQKSMEAMGGQNRDVSDDERLTEAREQAERDREAMQSDAFGAEQAGRMFTFLNNTIGANTSASQKAQMSVYLRDMGRVLRGQSLTP